MYYSELKNWILEAVFYKNNSFFFLNIDKKEFCLKLTVNLFIPLKIWLFLLKQKVLCQLLYFFLIFVKLIVNYYNYKHQKEKINYALHSYIYIYRGPKGFLYIRSRT